MWLQSRSVRIRIVNLECTKWNPVAECVAFRQGYPKDTKTIVLCLGNIFDACFLEMWEPSCHPPTPLVPPLLEGGDSFGRAQLVAYQKSAYFKMIPFIKRYSDGIIMC